MSKAKKNNERKVRFLEMVEKNSVVWPEHADISACCYEGRHAAVALRLTIARSQFQLQQEEEGEAAPQEPPADAQAAPDEEAVVLPVLFDAKHARSMELCFVDMGTQAQNCVNFVEVLAEGGMPSSSLNHFLDALRHHNHVNFLGAISGDDEAEYVAQPPGTFTEDPPGPDASIVIGLPDEFMEAGKRVTERIRERKARLQEGA